MPNLKDRALAPRPRAALEAILATTSSTLELGLNSTIDEFEQQLFKLAEQAHSNDSQNRCFESLREVRRGRADVVPRFMLRLEAALATITDEPASPEFMRVSRGGKAELALIDPLELEQALALQELSSKAEIRNTSALFLLGQRFGVLAGMPAFEADKLPVGPHRLCACLAEAARCLDLQFEHRMLLFRMFDRQSMPVLSSLYDQLNALCVRERVLPNLQVHVVFKRMPNAQTGEATPAAPVAHRPAQGEVDDAGFLLGSPSDAAPHAANAQRQHAPAAPRDAPRGASPRPQVARQAYAPPAPAGQANPAQARAAPQAGAPAAAPGEGEKPPAATGPFANPMLGWPGTPPPYQPERRAPAPAPARPDALEIELFDTLRELLSGRRHAIGAAEPAPGATSHAPQPEELQRVLAMLQGKPAPPIMIDGKLVPRTITHLRQDVLNHLRRVVPEGKQPRLAEADSDTMELVGMLFDHLLRDHKPGAAVQDLMTRLQVPLLRVALRDRTFFTRRSHPARQMLNMIAEAGAYWVGDQVEDKPLLEKMRMVVDRIAGEYSEDLSIFDELAGDFSGHLGTLARKSELAERRHVDAARGREKLDVARTAAAKAVSAAMQGHRPPALVKTLLDQAWTDVLALTLLRQGESSEVYRRRLRIAERLIEATTQGAGRVAPGEAEAAALQREIEAGLSQVGYHVDDVRSVVGRFFGSRAAEDEEAASATELAMKLKARARLGEDTSAESGRRDARARIHPPLDAEELRLLERLKSVPFGTWFEFESNQQGDKVRRKLSWFSPLTGRCLFVNQRGARVDEKTLEQLAREISKRRASVVEAEKESMIDRAWNAIVSTLKQFSGAPAPRPA